jgi:transposase-like protein
MARSHRSAEKESFWRLAVDEHRRSGLTIRAFCQREGLSEPSFHGWRREIQKRDGKRPSPTACERQSLIPVDVVAEVDSGLTPCHDARLPVLEVVTPSGFTLRFHANIEPQQLRTLLAAIAGCHGGGAVC